MDRWRGGNEELVRRWIHGEEVGRNEELVRRWIDGEEGMRSW